MAVGCFSADQVNEAFLAAPPLIAQTIIDLSVKTPNWMRDVWQMEEWPLGNGTQMEQLVFRGAMPQIERGFNNWTQLGNLQGCEPCEGPNCGYNWTPFGGYGFQRKITNLMSREFRSPDYCIAEIQTTAHFREVFAKVVENLYRQTDFFKEMNIGLNFLTGLAKKYVIDGSGPNCNRVNPYVYPNTGGVQLSNLNIELLTFFYEAMRRMPDAVPYDVVDGAPIYSLIASHELLARLYRDDPNLRQDVRFSGLANDLLMKYNFMSTIRGMFIAAPVLYPRRFNVVAGVPVEVLPFVNGIPADIGAYTGLNPEYDNAAYEEIILHGKHPFKVFTYPTEQTLGGGTSFGPEFSFMNNWLWVNPLTECDPFRRVGYFATSAKIGLSQQFSEGIFGVLVARPSRRLMAQYNPVPVCPPADPAPCTNIIPEQGCPCPIVLSYTPHPLTAGDYYIYFASPVEGDPLDVISFVLGSGANINGTLVELSADGLVAQVTIAAGLLPTDCTEIVSINCVNTLVCSSRVVSTINCRSAATNAVDAIVENALRVDVGEVVTAFFADCTQGNMTVLAIDAANLTYTLRYAAGFGPTDNPTGAGGPPATNSPLTYDLTCDRGGIVSLCVPTTTDATCPACGNGPVFSDCVPPEEEPEA